MDLWVGLVIFVLFGIVIGSERQLSRGVAAKPGWRGSEGARLLTAVTLGPAMTMFATGVSSWQRGDPVGVVVMAVFGAIFVADWWFWLNALGATRRPGRLHPG